MSEKKLGKRNTVNITQTAPSKKNNDSKDLVKETVKDTIPIGTSGGNVRVVCRFRPLNKKELEMGMADNICIDFVDKETVSMKNVHDGLEKPKFNFDKVFPMASNQEEVYIFAAKPVIESVLQGFNGTVFAYGQTSSGKTHTMQGPNIEDEDLKGIIPRMVNTVFAAIYDTPEHIEFKLKVSLVEIYCEKIRDLLEVSKTDLKIREDKNRGIYIQDVTEEYVSEESNVYELMKVGNSNRAISATNMNEGSSRSHSIFILTISQNNLKDMSAKTGKLFLVDLAGSEKISKTGAKGQTLDEAKMINKSLSSLGNVINALTDGKSNHIPYRDSKLTRILQESLGGNSRTTLIITCSPSPFNEAETLSTLRFGIRAKSIKNKPKINREFTVAELQILLAKSEKMVSEKEARIRQLEEYIKNMGNTVPAESQVEVAEEEEVPVKEDEGENDEENEKEDEFPEKSVPVTESTNEDMEKIKLLEGQLEIESGNVRIQTEKLNLLRKEFALLNAKAITQEEENEQLIHKLTSFTMKSQEFDEMIKEKEEKIEQLEQLKMTHLSEIEGLKNSKDHLMQMIQDKNKEIEKIESINTSSFHNNSICKSIQTNPEEIEANFLGIRPSLAKKLEIGDNNKGGLKIGDNFFRYLYEDTKPKPQKIIEKKEAIVVNPGLDETAVNKYKDMEKKLEEEQIINEQLSNELNGLKTEFKVILNNKLPDIEEITKNVTNMVKKQEEENFEKERITLIKDLQNRVDKVAELEVELDEQKEKFRHLENSMTNGEKSLKKKVTALEQNLESLTLIYHQLVSKMTITKVENQNFDSKLKRKNERLLLLEKNYLEIKEAHDLYKSKYETLKKIVNQNEFASKIFSLTNPFPSIKSNGSNNNIESKEKEENKQDFIPNKITFSIPSTKNIVKPIKGGQGHGKKSSFKNNFANVIIPGGDYKLVTEQLGQDVVDDKNDLEESKKN